MFLLLFIIDIDKITTKAHLQLKSESIIDKLTLNKYLFEDNAFTNEPEEPLKKKTYGHLMRCVRYTMTIRVTKHKLIRGGFWGLGRGAVNEKRY